MTTLRGLIGIRTLGSGSAFPADLAEHGVAALGELDNAGVFALLLGSGWRGELERRGWDVAHPARRWGVERRQWLVAPAGVELAREPVELASERLAALAAERALADAGLEACELDLFVLATSTPGRASSSAAANAARLVAGWDDGADATLLDLRAGGAGGVQALVTAAAHLRAGHRRALVVASECISPWLAADRPGACLVYGDGAAAAVLERDDDSVGGLLGARTWSAQVAGRSFTVPGPLPPDPAQPEAYRFRAPDEEYVGGLAAVWRRACFELADELEEEVRGARWFLPHAATAEQVRLGAAALGVDAARTHTALARRGCTGCAGPWIAFHELRARGELERGDAVVLAAAAGGVCTAGAVWRLA